MTDVETRREARRRKILENSENRLMKITGVEKKSTKAEVDGILNSLENQNDLSLNHSHSRTSSLSQNEVTRNTAADEEVETIFSNPSVGPNESITSHVEALQQQKFRKYILIMPVILSLLLVICDNLQLDTQYLHIDKIFAPLIVLEIVDCCFGSSVNTAPSIFSTISLLTNRYNVIRVYSEHIHICFQYIFKIIQDVIIYFFLFMVSHTFMNYFFSKI